MSARKWLSIFKDFTDVIISLSNVGGGGDTGSFLVTVPHVSVHYFLCIFMFHVDCHIWIYEGLTKLLVIRLGLFVCFYYYYYYYYLAFVVAVRSKQY
jgi:hypothetical protein